ncbi:putative quinol monooxygenase [Kitasatospora sp. NPDC048540]|uniref:putative quinol monooxygenase n=1 Tax=unclassified Kitasatospora TaxID=2633591 RepID=UPI00053A0A50|nr:putative quinol monooxygenase [Kitasatospora sp. MBT63]
MTEVTVVGRAVAKPGKRDQVERLLRAVISPTHEEEGSLHYSMHQGIDDPDTFVAVERWTSAEALEQHLATPHLQHLAEQIGDLLAQPLDISTFSQLHEGGSDKGVL